MLQLNLLIMVSIIFSEYTEDGNVITIDSATDGYVFFN